MTRRQEIDERLTSLDQDVVAVWIEHLEKRCEELSSRIDETSGIINNHQAIVKSMTDSERIDYIERVLIAGDIESIRIEMRRWTSPTGICVVTRDFGSRNTDYVRSNLRSAIDATTHRHVR